MPSLHEAQRRVQRQCARVEKCADSDCAGFVRLERRLWTEVLALGRAVVALYLVRRASRPGPVDYLHDSQRYRLDEVRTTELGTRFGKVTFARRVGRRVGAAGADADLPVDRELGLCGGFSLGVVLAMTTLVASKVEYDSVAAYWHTTERAGAPFVLLRKKLGEEKFANVAQEAREYLLEKIGSGKVTLVAEAIFTSATRV